MSRLLFVNVVNSLSRFGRPNWYLPYVETVDPGLRRDTHPVQPSSALVGQSFQWDGENCSPATISKSAGLPGCGRNVEELVLRSC